MIIREPFVRGGRYRPHESRFSLPSGELQSGFDLRDRTEVCIWAFDQVERVKLKFLWEMGQRARDVIGDSAVAVLDVGGDELGGYVIFEDRGWERVDEWASSSSASAEALDDLACRLRALGKQLADANMIHGGMGLATIWMSGRRPAFAGFGMRVAQVAAPQLPPNTSVLEYDATCLGEAIDLLLARRGEPR